MTTEQFAYWLQGFSEIHGAPPSAEQWEMIKEHLQTCFKKVTSDRHNIYVEGGSNNPGLVQPGIAPLNVHQWPHSPSDASGPQNHPYTITC